MKITLTDQEWIQLLDGNSDDSELPVCCANVSALRDVLGQVVRNGRHHEIEVFTADNLRQKLKWVTDGHELTKLPVLKKLAEQVGFDEASETHKPQPMEIG